jgi:hypothetical protein
LNARRCFDPSNAVGHGKIHARWSARPARAAETTSSSGASPGDSPILRRPDLLLTDFLWQNHPSLSWLFSGMFIGRPARPAVDEARNGRFTSGRRVQELDRTSPPSDTPP